jgi:hypothetical protein
VCCCSIDPDFDGDISRGEFDNDKLQFKLVDFIMDDVAPAPDTKPATDTKQPTAESTIQPLAAAEPVPPTDPAAAVPDRSVLLKEIDILAARVAELENP